MYQLTLSGQPPPLGEVAVSSLSPGTPPLLWDPSHSPVLQSQDGQLLDPPRGSISSTAAFP